MNNEQTKHKCESCGSLVELAYDHSYDQYVYECRACGHYREMSNHPDREPVERDEPSDMTDVEADAQTLAGAGYGTDEDYGYYGEPYECD